MEDRACHWFAYLFKSSRGIMSIQPRLVSKCSCRVTSNHHCNFQWVSNSLTITLRAFFCWTTSNCILQITYHSTGPPRTNLIINHQTINTKCNININTTSINLVETTIPPIWLGCFSIRGPGFPVPTRSNPPTLRRKEQPSVSLARPPVGWQSITLQFLVPDTTHPTPRNPWPVFRGPVKC